MSCGTLGSVTSVVTGGIALVMFCCASLAVGCCVSVRVLVGCRASSGVVGVYTGVSESLL